MISAALFFGDCFKCKLTDTILFPFSFFERNFSHFLPSFKFLGTVSAEYFLNSFIQSTVERGVSVFLFWGSNYGRLIQHI